MIWDISWEESGSSELREKLAEGWEPFAVVGQPCLEIVYLRKRVSVLVSIHAPAWGATCWEGMKSEVS